MTDDIRHRYADAIHTCGPLTVTKVLYAVMAVRDEELEHLRTEVARLRAGESETPAAEGHYPTPAEWIHRWNRSTPEQRLDRAAWVLVGMRAAQRCEMADHEAAVAIEGFATRARLLHPTPAELVASNAQSDTLCTTCISPAPCPTRRALDGQD